MEPKLVEVPGAKFVRAVIAYPDGNEFLISNRRGSGPRDFSLGPDSRLEALNINQRQ